MKCEHNWQPLDMDFPAYLLCQCRICGEKVKFRGLQITNVKESHAKKDAVVTRFDIRTTERID